MIILVYLKNWFQGTKLDRFFRLIINRLAPYYYKFSKKDNSVEEKFFIYICYGGLGDCVLAFPFLIKLSKLYKIIIFIDVKFKGIEILLNKNFEVKFYNKKFILKDLSHLKKKNQNLILIQQSPILEFILFHTFLGKPPTIGFIYKQNQIAFEGFPLQKKETKEENKLLKYDFLLKNVLNVWNKNNIIFHSRKKFSPQKKINCSNFPNIPYFILSPTKDANWSMGFLDYKVYANFIRKMILRTNLTPVIVGANSDQKIIENILNNLPSRCKLINLVGRTSIKELIGLLIDCEFVVANDNGVHHMSNFLNKKTLTLYNFSSHKVYNWRNENSKYIFKPFFDCMPCVGHENGPFDNYPFKCPWNVRCKNTISEEDIINKLSVLKWI